jgi:hypothetical protein
MSFIDFERIPYDILLHWYAKDLRGPYHHPSVVEIVLAFDSRCSTYGENYKLKELKQRIAAYEEPEETVEENPSN